MKPFYTLSQTAGLIRSNKFTEKVDAITIASHRAQVRAMPIKIYEHKDSPADKKCILIANVDGSVEKPKGYGDRIVEPGHNSTARNLDQAHLLMASTAKAFTTIYLKNQISEYQVANIEHLVQCAIGLYDNRVLHVHSEDSAMIKKIEAELTTAKIEIDRTSKHVIEAGVAGKEPVMSSARRAAARAKAASLPELSTRASVRAGRNHKIQCACELYENGKEAPVIAVFADGKKIAEVRSDVEAARAMSQYATSAFGKFLKKELA